MNCRKFYLFLCLSFAGLIVLPLNELNLRRFGNNSFSVHSIINVDLDKTKRPLSWKTDRKVNSILLFIGIFSAARHIERRNAVRETWMTRCRNTEDVVCWFITDGQDARGKPLQGEVISRLENESRVHGDLLFAQSPAGTNFARRYIWMIQWASRRYKFQYLLRIDDDYFICFERLLLELRFYRPREKLAWGWLHCKVRGGVAIDEGFVIVTKDVIESILARVYSSLVCHPYGTQALGMWLKEVPDLQTFGDNRRIFHSDFVSKERAASRSEICNTALAIHKSYPEEMKIYWNVHLKENNNNYSVPPIVFPCDLPHFVDSKVYVGKWFAKLRLCKYNPVWGRDEYFKGRRG